MSVGLVVGACCEKLNSSQINELGNWCLKGLWGAESISQGEGIHGNPGSGNHPQK